VRTSDLHDLFARNRAWADAVEARDPGFFRRLADVQSPAYLWIGCADSRVPANEIVGLLPGELFVHRNVANVVVHTDLNCLSVLQYAVHVLGVGDVIVCGHYGCGGVAAALEGGANGLIDNWLRHVQDVHRANAPVVAAVPAARRQDAMCELNVIHQVVNVARTTVMEDAWREGRTVDVHGWIYGLQDGLLRDLGVSVSSPDGIEEARAAAVARTLARHAGTD
jgi:carbonic anhydrase